MKSALALGFLTVLAVAVPLSGQDRQASGSVIQPRFRAGVDLVTLDVCVKGPDGQLIRTLAPEDFLILEDQVPQSVSFFVPSRKVPLAAVMLIDRSGSMYGQKFEQAKAAATALIRTMNPDDRVGIFTFSESAERVMSLGANFRGAEQAVDNIPAAFGVTGLHEAILIGLGDLARFRENARREYRYALIILSDGDNTSGRLTFDEMLKAVRRSHVIVYAVTPRLDDRRRRQGPGYVLGQLAHDTGGQAITANGPESLTPIFEEIGLELRYVYRVGYVSTNDRRNGAWRSISIRVTTGDARARSRHGYYTARPTR